jgi:lysophospholipase L1-like esterase
MVLVVSGSASGARDIRVCFVGDSYVAGVGDATGLGWVGRLASHAHACGVPVTAYNLGVRGDTSLDVAGRLAGEVGRRCHPAAELRVVLAYGLNDVIVVAGRRRVDGPDSVAATSRSLAWLASAGIPAIFVGPPPVGDPAQDSRTADLDRRLAGGVARHGVGYVSAYEGLAGSAAWLEGVRDGDGAHPGAAGYQEYFAAVRDPLTRFIREGAVPGIATV